MKLGFHLFTVTLLLTGCTKPPTPRAPHNPHAALIRKLARLESAAEMKASAERLTQLEEDVRIEAELVPLPPTAAADFQDLLFRIELVRLDAIAARIAVRPAGRGLLQPVDLWTAQPNSSDLTSFNLARLHDSARDLRRALWE